MSTTIDSLQIEIQSSSTNASKSIDDLSKSLGNLKKNGAFKTVSTNLTHLSEALKGLPNVHGASNSLRTLANSIEKLKSVGTISSLSNSIAKLPAAFKSLEGINLGSVGAQIRSVVDAMEPLTQLKGSGFSSMVNAMGKIEKVTESLDTQKITAFAAKIKELSAAVEPFATKMGTIQSAFNGLNTAIKQTNVSIDNANAQVNVTAFNFSNMANVINTVYSALQSVIQGFTSIVHSASEWDGIAARFGRGFGAQAQETYEWIQRLNEEMGINVQVAMQHSSIYANMLTGFGVASEDASKMALGYTELTYDIWAGYNDIYQSYEEAAEAIRSAIAGEVEPIRRAGFTIIESTLEQTAANHGLEISLANATEAQKSYLRYLTLVDQAHAQNLVGTYAKEMNTAEGMMRTFSQQLKSLTQAFGSLFLPALVKVMPYLQAFVELLTEGVRWLGGLLGIEIQDIGDTWGDYSSGVSDAVQNTEGVTGALNDATKAAKELKNATLGIDELNVISPNASSGSGGGGGSGGGSGGSGFSGLDIDSLWDETIFDNIQSDVDAIKEKMRGWLPVIASVSTALAGLRLVNLLKDMEAIAKLSGAIAAVGGAFKGIKEFFLAAKQMAPEVGWLAALFPKLSGWLSGIGTALAGISAPVWAAIAAAIVAVASAIYFVVENWNELKAAAVEFFKENIAPKLEEIGKHFDKINEALAPVYDLLRPIIVSIKDFFKNIDWSILGKIVEWIGGIVVGLLTIFNAGFFNAGIALWENLIQILSGTIQTIRGVVDFIIAIFNGGDVEAAVQKMVSGIKDIFGGTWGAVIDTVVGFYEGVVGWFKKLWDVLVGHSIVPDTINAIVEWFVSLPGKVLGSVESFVKGIVDKFSNLGKSLSDKFSSAWEAVKTWWSKKSGLASYTPSIGNIASKLSSAWSNAKDWWKEKRSSLSYTPSIGSISSKLSSAWTTAKNWWNKNRSSLSYTPSIGSIKDKIVSAWNSAKSWWNKNAKLSTKLDIKVPTISVKWSTAEAFGKSFKYPTGFSLKFAANGGIFDQGSLIWAGERGPEVMATAAGGKTGVMNVQQMQDAVYEGVYAAVSAAMRGNNGGGSQDVRVYIDGREVSNVVKKYARESGATIVGNEVYGY